MSLPAPVASRLGLLIPRLASNHDGEVINTVRAIERTLRAGGRDLHDLARTLVAATMPAPAPPPWQSLVRECRRHIGALSAKERDFVVSLSAWRGEPSAKQLAWLQTIHDRIAGR